MEGAVEISRAVEDRIRGLPCWHGSIEIAPLKGGMSNESYLVIDGQRHCVVRFGADFPFHHVSRERELMVARAAYAGGFGPEVHYAEPGLMVSAYLGAKTLSAGDVVVERQRVASLLKRFHTEMPARVSGPAFLFWPFHTIRDYARTLMEGKSPDLSHMPSFLTLSEELEGAQVPLPIVFGHNDLLPSNILDDGERLWLIDFEYAGYSTAMFDLAGATSNSRFTADEAKDFLDAYFGEPAEPAVRRAHAAMQCASLLREALWSMVSERHLASPGTNYERYTQMNLERLAEALEDYRVQYGKSVK